MTRGTGPARSLQPLGSSAQSADVEVMADSVKSAGGVQSLFTQRLDRALFRIYLLAAVVPMLALGWVVRDYVLPTYPDDPRALWAWIGGLAALGSLILTLYLALRRISHTTLSRMERDNQRLARLLQVSRSVVGESEYDAIARQARRSACEISGATQALLLVQTGDGKEFALFEDGGSPAALMDTHGEVLTQLAEESLRTGQLASLAGADSRSGLEAAVAIPLEQPGESRGSLVLIGQDPSGFDGDTLDALQTLSALTSMALVKGGLELAQRNFFSHVTELMVTALDAHVDEREGHATNVARLANQLARELGVDEERLADIHFVALLHDIGMLRIDRRFHRTPKACRKHCAMGARMLGRIRFWEHLAPAVLQHHEWFDGSGYPEGKQGEEIAREARIIAVADAADAMTRGRGADTASILTELERASGSQFDPAVVDAYRALHERGEIASLQA